MTTTFTIERDDDRQTLVAYLKLSDLPIKRSVELDHGKVVVDEAAGGSLIGVEFIRPDHIHRQLKQVAERYHKPDLGQAVDEFFAVC